MIPKKIHYCWFGRKELPEKAKKCIASWKKYCPDFEIIEWNEDNIDVYQNPYTTYTYDNKRFAFLSDYLRLLIVYKEGGIYFDVDVEVVRSIDELLENQAFFGFETKDYINTGLGFGAEAGNAINCRSDDKRVRFAFRWNERDDRLSNLKYAGINEAGDGSKWRKTKGGKCSDLSD